MLGPAPDALLDRVFSSAVDWRLPSGTSHQSLRAWVGENSSPTHPDKLGMRRVLAPRQNLLHNVSSLMTSLPSFCVDCYVRRGSKVVAVVVVVVVEAEAVLTAFLCAVVPCHRGAPWQRASCSSCSFRGTSC